MIEELEWDTRLLQRKIGRLRSVPAERILGSLLRKAKGEEYDYLTCRLRAGEIGSVRVLEKKGFYLTDIGISLQRNTNGIKGAFGALREAVPGDIPMLRKMVKGLFTDSRFYHDPFFRKDRADRIFEAWIENSVKGFADKVFLAEGKGFVTCKVSGNRGEIPLIGVSPQHRATGVGTSLVAAALKWFREAGTMSVAVRTQADNIVAITFYSHLGFEVESVDITMGMVLND